MVQAYLARGDRRLGPVLAAALENGGDLPAALRDIGLDASSYLYRERRAEEVLPWDHIDAGIDKHYLLSEYKNALKGATTAACDVGNCRACGACD